ncbi:ABC transporter ATP-binding protein [Paenibacillus sp. alder61]|uniref:ABC transporter ATP-binding protein n=1 Tax=Paenibacillus faecis TaxID=862114 RepID=A0A5D0CK05_9BACL|nr:MULTISPECIES: ABC transporter ATP-binding protein [Paenibacillus]MCA1294526.1 ABC transporter ATP-binding protein [Paenibacillus sp. alder61]TYA10309.1 ABC transporter ATP-binding protein [Paenibacillus faecis]
MIEIKHLSKKYRRGGLALNDVTLTLHEGMVGLLGPNGAGKSSLMRILATLVEPTSGEASINGIPLRKAEDIRKIIGYLPQQFQVYPQLTGSEYLDYVGAMKGMNDPKQRKREIGRLLEEVNLQDKAGKRVKTYSGGMKRRLGIAQALLGSPQVLIVDEPTAGLDPEERVRFRNLLTRFSLGRIVLLSTHIVADIESNCRQIAVLDRGRVRMSGELTELQEFGRGKVWEEVVSEEQFARLDPMSIVSTRRTENGLRCRIIGETPPAGSGAVQVRPSLEDGYLALLRSGRKEGAYSYE